MTLKINTNIERFEKELSIKDKIKNLFNFKKENKKTKEQKNKLDDTKMFTETLIVDEILEE